jgi:hypothetical protein
VRLMTLQSKPDEVPRGMHCLLDRLRNEWHLPRQHRPSDLALHIEVTVQLFSPPALVDQAEAATDRAHTTG